MSLVYTGTWGVDQGGVRLLERYTDRVVVGAQGYGEGRVGLTGFDVGLRLFRGIDADPAKLIRNGGYYSFLGSYAGTAAGQLTVRGADPGTGLGVGYDRLSKKRLEVVLSASAVTGTVGPHLGWAPANKKLLRNAILWGMHPNR